MRAHVALTLFRKKEKLLLVASLALIRSHALWLALKELSSETGCLV